jgi:ribonucleoside-diphosphate reductase alpha chain
MGAPRTVTPYNCFVSGTIEDSMEGIMDAAKMAALTMKLGGGIGYDFSTIRPRRDLIQTLDSYATGPVSFMGIFDAVCKTIASAGHRRGAQMGVLRVDHPDIEEFVRSKQNREQLTTLNISCGITDTFMQAVRDDRPFDLVFGGRVYKTIRARDLWEEIMRSTWNWAEPGVLFIDRINDMNNLWYCETIAATNPCGEQPLPPNGACLLGSINLVRYIDKQTQFPGYTFNYEKLKADMPHIVRAMDNVVDRATYPLEAQKKEAHDKRRMGLGVCGLANAAEVLGLPYGSEDMLTFTRTVLSTIRDAAYNASVDLAIEKGPFPLCNPELYQLSGFVQTLPLKIRERIAEHGIRNSHLLSIAPTGTISLAADNVSGGIEPPFSLEYTRTKQEFDDSVELLVQDYAYRKYGTRGRTATECTGQEHVAVLCAAQQYVDSACSKTCNVDPNMPWEDFKNLYMQAWEGGAKGCTTFNPSGKRFGILKERTPSVEVQVENQTTEVEACYINPQTGERSCA